MNERQSDFEWLQQFARTGNQGAFRDIVRRHIDLVFATALHKVGDAGGAEEISQNVFGVLARKSWQFAPDDSLPAWLYKTALLESKSWLRGEIRRRRREQAAAELGTTMKTSEDQSAFNALVPLLDIALASLREKDRAALLLRYYEKQSLRDVGAALNVGEDAAQKRVQGALEKLSEFFQRRGYKTATVAAAAAALQQTATSASAATISAIASAALQSAPPALAGLAGLLARFASLTKVQTAAVCVVVAVVPVFWEWQQDHRLAGATVALHEKLNALQGEQAESSAELERLQAESSRLAQKQAAMLQDQDRAAAAAQKLASLKTRSRALLVADDYRWPDDLPFVRVPKSALASIHMGGGPTSPEKLAFKVNQFLDLTPQERDATSQVFSNYFGEIDHLIQTSLYETNRASSLSLPPEAESRVFVLLPLGEKIRAAMDQLCAGLETTLGGGRWAMIQPDQFEFTHYEQVRLLGYTTFAWDTQQEIAVNIFSKPGAEPTVSWAASAGNGSSPVPLRSLLSANALSPFSFGQGPPALIERVTQYILAEAKNRLSTTATK